MEKEIREVAVEINSIFDNMSLEILNKIPQKVQKFFREIESDTYKFNYNPEKSLNEQELKDRTRGIIALLYRDYICDEEEKKQYNIEYSKFIEKKEEEKRQKYNVDNIFKNKKDNIINNELPLVIEKENLLKRIFNKIKSFFKK